MAKTATLMNDFMPNLGIFITNFFLKKKKLHAVAIHTDGYILQISKMFFFCVLGSKLSSYIC